MPDMTQESGQGGQLTRGIERRDVLKGIGAAGVVGLAGCLGDSDVDIGLLMGVSGPLDELGPPIRDGAEAALDIINDGDNDWELESRFEDTETDADAGVEGAEALVDAGAPMYVGALASQVSLRVYENVTEPEGVIQMSPASTAVDFTDNGMWRTAPSDAFQGAVLAEIATDHPDHGLGAATASTLARDDAYGRGLAEEFVAAFEEHGGEVLTEEILDEEQDSYEAEIGNALEGDPDVLFYVDFPEDGQTLLRNFYESFDEPDLPILVPDGLIDGDLPDLAGQDVETFSNVTGTGPGVADELASGLDALRDEIGDTADSVFVRESFDAAAILSLARVAADSDDPADIEAAIRDVTEPGGESVNAANLSEGVELADDGEDISYEGVSRPIEFDENRDVANPAYNYFGWTEDEDGNPTTELIDLLVLEE